MGQLSVCMFVVVCSSLKPLPAKKKALPPPPLTTASEPGTSMPLMTRSVCIISCTKSSHSLSD